MNAEITKTLRVFAVDDSAILRQRLVEMLSELERVEVVGDAEGRDEAIAGITRLEPDVVVLDI